MGSSSTLSKLAQSAGLVLVGALVAQLARLLVLPGARRRRQRLAYLIANFGSASSKLERLEKVAVLSPRYVTFQTCLLTGLSFSGSSSCCNSSTRRTALRRLTTNPSEEWEILA